MQWLFNVGLLIGSLKSVENFIIQSKQTKGLISIIIVSAHYQHYFMIPLPLAIPKWAERPPSHF